MVMVGGLFLAVAALVIVAAVLGQLAGASPTAPAKIGLVCSVLLLSAVGVIALVVPGPTTLSAAPAPASTSPAESPTAGETKALDWMHRKTVDIFIDRPGFGVRRLIMPLDDVVKAPKSLADKDTAEKPSGTGNPVAPGETEKPAKKTHYDVQDAIQGKDPLKFGQDQILTDDKKEEWKVRKVLLVGLVKHKAPVVYLTEKMPDMKDIKEVPTRVLDAFEKTALEAIRGGDNLKAEKKGKDLRVLGPIYAGQRCTTCHETKGQLLGAFSYQLERVPVEAEKKSPEPRLP
jgi:hypothetical protein